MANQSNDFLSLALFLSLSHFDLYPGVLLSDFSEASEKLK